MALLALGDRETPVAAMNYLKTVQVTKDTPPCFIWQTFDDKTVPVENSLLFATALRKAGVPFDLHIYQKGGHGMGLAGQGPVRNQGTLHPWTNDCLYWLKVQGFVK